MWFIYQFETNMLKEFREGERERNVKQRLRIDPE